MKSEFLNLKLGQLFEASIVEKISNKEFIVNYHGSLLRIRNESQNSFQMGDLIELQVKSLNPYSFRWNQSIKNQRSRETPASQYARPSGAVPQIKKKQSTTTDIESDRKENPKTLGDIQNLENFSRRRTLNKFV